ncbi:MAG: sphingomyelin synthase family protein [Planctomycetes bacterium]|nr:sphingomyelin synthase family protein [Planctomycetota bacterium]
MTAVGENSTIAAQRPAIVAPRPRLRPLAPAGETVLAPEIPGAGVRAWTRDVLACRYLLVLSCVFLGVALLADYACGTYVTSRPAVQVPDLILDRLPPVNLAFLFTYGYMTLIVGMFLCPLLLRARMLHVVAIQFSLLLLLRSLSMIFTHLATPAGAVTVEFPGIFSKLYFENDMFFSGHTAMPFLGFYLFRHSPIRYVFLVGSIVMAIVVLAMHLHYSIDVLSAFFMTYGSYRMGNVLLRKLDPDYTE